MGFRVAWLAAGSLIVSPRLTGLGWRIFAESSLEPIEGSHRIDTKLFPRRTGPKLLPRRTGSKLLRIKIYRRHLQHSSHARDLQRKLLETQLS